MDAAYACYSVDFGANSVDSKVKLTAFSCLSSELPPDESQSSTNSSVLSAAASLDTADQLLRARSDNKIGSQLISKSAAINFLGHANGNRTDGQRASRQSFQVVWRQLTYEVDTKSYDKLVTNAFHTLTSVWSKSLSSVSSTDRLHSSTTNINPPKEREQQPKTFRNPSKRTIFENVNGYAKSGQITAILGPSGAGKTSLLNALCGRNDNYRGSIELRGGSSGENLCLSMIPQKNHLIESLTVRESLLFASKILNPSKRFDHEANIVRVVRMLDLSTCFQSSISQISGGEYKRVSIAHELLCNPDILILDEPTSGLDSLNCKNLIRSLKSLIEASRAGRINPIAIVMSIHQPDIEVFHMLDHVYCMARDGQMIYDGRPRDTMRVLRSCAEFDGSNVPPELRPPPPETTNSNAERHPEDHGDREDSEPVFVTNPANVLIEIASGALYGPRPINSLARLQREQFEMFYHNKLEGVQRAQNVDLSLNTDGKKLTGARALSGMGGNLHGSLSSSTTSSSSRISRGLLRDKRLNSRRRNPDRSLFIYHTNLLIRREFQATIRDPLLTLASLLFHLIIPFVMYTVYPADIGSTHGCPLIVREHELLSMANNRTVTIMEDLQEQLFLTHECGCMFFLTIYSFTISSIASAALAFPMSMHVLLKEVRNGWYDLSSFVTAKTLASFPLEVLFPVISIIMIYIMLGMPSSHLEWRLWAIASVVVIVSMIGQTNGLIFGALCMDSVQTTVFLGIASTLPQILISGFVARVRYMPWWLAQLSWLSPFRYSIEMVSIIRFGFGLCPCDASTDEYLRDQRPHFKDVPAQVKSLFAHYLTSSMLSTSPGEDADDSTRTFNGTTAADSSLEFLANNGAAEGQRHVPGVFYASNLNVSERAQLTEKLESNEWNIFEEMAGILSRLFAYGQRVESCKSIRPQSLNTFDTPQDEELPKLYVCIIGLLIMFKIILILVVKSRVGARV